MRHMAIYGVRMGLISGSVKLVLAGVFECVLCTYGTLNYLLCGFVHDVVYTWVGASVV